MPLLSAPFDNRSSYQDSLIPNFELVAWMAWPDKPEMRRNFLATFAAHAIETFKTIASQDREDLAREIREDWKDLSETEKGDALEIVQSGYQEFMQVKTHYFIDNLLPRFGGLRTLVQSPAYSCIWKEFEKALFGVYVAGFTLTFITSMDTHHKGKIRGGASVKKALYLISILNKGTGLPVSEKRLKAEWVARKRVAHLCAAFTAKNDLTADNAQDTAELEDLKIWNFDSRAFLAMMFTFQDFATTFVPQGRKEPLISLDEIFRLPEEWRPDPKEISFSIDPLTSEQIGIVKSYRAPSAYF